MHLKGFNLTSYQIFKTGATAYTNGLIIFSFQIEIIASKSQHDPSFVLILIAQLLRMQINQTLKLEKTQKPNDKTLKNPLFLPTMNSVYR